MAASLPHIVLSFGHQPSTTFLPGDIALSTTHSPFLRRHRWKSSRLQKLETLHKTSPSLVITSALPSSASSPSPPSASSTSVNETTTKDNSLKSIITELDREKQVEEKEIEEEAAEDPSMKLNKRWKEIAGQDDWAGMLDPIDPLLRKELIRIGEFTQATYDSYDFDHFSKYCGSCRFNRRKFFESLEMADSGYEVTRYLYATSNIKLPKFFKKSRLPNLWSESANWIGYVAVSNDEETKRLGRRDIVVAWRGTVTNLEWISDIMDYLVPASSEGIPCPDPEVKIESGFLNLYTDKDPNCRFCKYSAREQILTEVRRLATRYPGEEMSVTITGHSLGAALAVLSAYDVAETGVNVSEDGRKIPVSVFSFAGPRVGNGTFKNRIEGLGVKVLRVVNVHDKVPQVPGVLMNERVPGFIRRFGEWLPWYYSHVGVELELDHKNSPYLRDTNDISCYHNLEAHLHLLDGYHGKDKGFELTTSRDPALVNKSADFLQDHLLIPPNWRQDENRGMIRSKDGRWMQPERPKLEDHPEDMHHHYERLSLGTSKSVYERIMSS